jgi:hypothetical protein
MIPTGSQVLLVGLGARHPHNRYAPDLHTTWLDGREEVDRIVDPPAEYL